MATNYALQSNGATATNFATGAATAMVNDGQKITDYGSGWSANVSFATSFQVDFGASRTITQIKLYGLRSAITYSVEATVGETSGFAFKNFDLYYWNGSAWVLIVSVTDNLQTVIKDQTFSAITTTKIKVVVTSTSDGNVYMNEIEAWSAPPDTTKPSDVTNLTATKVNDSRVDIDSDAATDNVSVSGYLTERRINGGSWVALTPTSKAFSDTENFPTVAGSYTFEYRRKAVDSSGNLSLNYSSITSAITITIVPPPITAIGGYDLLQTTGSYGCAEEISHAKLTADFGDGYEQSALIGAKTGLKSWRLKFNVLPGVISQCNPYFDEKAINQADYLWDFYCRKVIEGEPFVIESLRNKQYYLAKFLDEKLYFELFATRLFTTGIALQQRRIKDSSVFDLLKNNRALRVYNPTKLTLADNANVATLTDGKNSVDLTCASSHPIFKLNQQNGNPIIRFSGTSNPLISATALTIRHIFIVAKHSDSAFAAASALLSTPNDDLLKTTTGANYADLSGVINQTNYPTKVKVNGNFVALNSIPVPYNTWKLFEIRFDKDFTATGLKLGADKTAAVKHKGDVGDLFISDKKIFESDVWEIEEHLMKKWAIH